MPSLPWRHDACVASRHCCRSLDQARKTDTVGTVRPHPTEGLYPHSPSFETRRSCGIGNSGTRQLVMAAAMRVKNVTCLRSPIPVGRANGGRGMIRGLCVLASKLAFLPASRAGDTFLEHRASRTSQTRRAALCARFAMIADREDSGFDV